MSQADFTLDGTPVTGTSGTTMATLLNAWKAAVHSNHAGAARPSYAVASMIWVKPVSGTAHEVYYYDGTDDILMGTINPTGNWYNLTRVQEIYSTSAGGAPISPVSTPPDGYSLENGGKLTVSRSAGTPFWLARHGSDGVIQAMYRNNVLVGSIAVTTTTTTYNTSSDYRLKYDVEPVVTFDLGALDIGGPLGKLMRVRPVKYRMFADNGEAQHYGFIAHELQAEVPHAVTGFKDETREEEVIIDYVEDAGNPGTLLPVTELQQVPVMQGIDHSQIMSLAVAAIQQLTLRVMELEARFNHVEIK